MSNWISSESGRHFGDSLEGYSKKEQKDKIEKNLNSMFNDCLIYACPDHGGMYKDSVRINEYFTSLGLLLPTGTKKFNKKQYAKVLENVIETFNKKKEPNDVDKYILDATKEIYLNLCSV